MLTATATMEDVEKEFKALKQRTYGEKVELSLDEKELRKFFEEALRRFILEGELFQQRVIRAKKSYTIEHEAYIPYSIAGMYAGSFIEAEVVEEEVEVLIRASVENGRLIFEIEPDF